MVENKVVNISREESPSVGFPPAGGSTPGVMNGVPAKPALWGKSNPERVSHKAKPQLWQ